MVRDVVKCKELDGFADLRVRLTNIAYLFSG